MGSQIKSPISHISQTQEDEAGVVSSNQEEVILEAIGVRDGPDLKVDLEVDKVDFPMEKDFREESLTKALPPKDLEYPAKPKIKTKIDTIIAIREDISHQNAQRKQESNLKILQRKEI